jgi:hypothetical protein
MLDKACARRQYRVIAWLISQGANGWNDALFSACQNGDLVLAEEMVRRLRAAGTRAFTLPLLAAGSAGNLPVIQLLAANGANSFTPTLHNALRREDVSESVIAWLIEKGNISEWDSLIDECRKRTNIHVLYKYGAVPSETFLTQKCRCYFRDPMKAKTLINCELGRLMPLAEKTTRIWVMFQALLCSYVGMSMPSSHGDGINVILDRLYPYVKTMADAFFAKPCRKVQKGQIIQWVIRKTKPALAECVKPLCEGGNVYVRVPVLLNAGLSPCVVRRELCIDGDDICCEYDVPYDCRSILDFVVSDRADQVSHLHNVLGNFLHTSMLDVCVAPYVAYRTLGW